MNMLCIHKSYRYLSQAKHGVGGIQAVQCLLRTEVAARLAHCQSSKLIRINPVIIEPPNSPPLMLNCRARQVIEEENSSEGGRDGEVKVRRRLLKITKKITK